MHDGQHEGGCGLATRTNFNEVDACRATPRWDVDVPRRAPPKADLAPCLPPCPSSLPPSLLPPCSLLEVSLRCYGRDGTAAVARDVGGARAGAAGVVHGVHGVHGVVVGCGRCGRAVAARAALGGADSRAGRALGRGVHARDPDEPARRVLHAPRRLWRRRRLCDVARDQPSLWRGPGAPSMCTQARSPSTRELTCSLNARSQLLAVWTVAVLRSRPEPARFQLVELGPGRATLLLDMLRVCAKRQRAHRRGLLTKGAAVGPADVSEVPGRDAEAGRGAPGRGQPDAAARPARCAGWVRDWGRGGGGGRPSARGRCRDRARSHSRRPRRALARAAGRRAPRSARDPHRCTPGRRAGADRPRARSPYADLAQGRPS